VWLASILRWLPVLAVAAVLAVVGAAGAADRTPPGGPGPASAEAASGAGRAVVEAVVVKSWSGCRSDNVIWAALNAGWQSYGSTSIHIDYRNSALCDGPVTYDALEASGADVVILSDSAGGAHQLSADEIAAIGRYADEGHDLIGSYVSNTPTVTGSTTAGSRRNSVFAPTWSTASSRSRPPST
jgi:hypothetical protein